MSEPVYIVTDIEADGPDPARHSMISFAAVAVRATDGILGQFEANLAPRPDRGTDPVTTAWWQTQAEAFAATQANPQSPEAVMGAFADWVETFETPRAFAARPLCFDGAWIDTYLRDFVGTRAFGGPFPGRQPFTLDGLDIGSFLQALFGVTNSREVSRYIPVAWRGGHQHTHRAIDDALGYANILLNALRLSAARASAWRME